MLKINIKKPLAIFIYFASVASSFAAPVISIPEAHFNFGSVSQGTIVEHQFVVNNTGTEPLSIQRTAAPCGCTVAAATSEMIAPGASSTIKVTVDTSAFSGDQQKTVTVYSNDLSNPETILSLKGTIRSAGEVVPSRVDFGEKTAGEPLEKTVKLDLDSGYKFVSAKSFSKWINISEIPNKSSLRISLSPETPAGDFRERVIVTVKPEGEGEEVFLNIPVYGRLQSPITLRPRVLSFGVIEGEQELVRIVQIENRSKTDLTPGAVVSDSKAVKAEIKSQGEGKKYVLEVRVNPKEQFEELKALIALNINGEELRLPVYAIRPPKV